MYIDSTPEYTSFNSRKLAIIIFHVFILVHEDNTEARQHTHSRLGCGTALECRHEVRT